MADAERFRKAKHFARQIPPQVLTTAQKLKLYALYKQSESGSAPATGPPADIEHYVIEHAKVGSCHPTSSRARPSGLMLPRPLALTLDVAFRSGRRGTT